MVVKYTAALTTRIQAAQSMGVVRPVRQCQRTHQRQVRKSVLGGPHVNPTGPSAGSKSHFVFKVKAAPPGKYELSAMVVTVNRNQSLQAATVGKDGKTSPAMTLGLPFTLGKWETTPPIRLELSQGEITLQFWRCKPPQYGESPSKSLS